jgi:hypothetical protein
MEWLAIGLPHNSSHLFARLPFGDAVQLAALVGTGQMTWPEVNAALDARIKLAIAQLRARRGEWRAPADPHEVWEDARRAGEDEIWAHYHAKCDAVFAGDTTAGETDLRTTEALRDREHMLDRLRGERDRALAILSCRLGPQPPRQACTTPRAPAMDLTTSERDALRKLDASGFVSSTLMVEAIRSLATPLGGGGARCNRRSYPTALLDLTNFVLTPNTQTKTIPSTQTNVGQRATMETMVCRRVMVRRCRRTITATPDNI